MFDERVFPYSPPGGIQVFRKALALATTCILFCRMLCSAAWRIVAEACLSK